MPLCRDPLISQLNSLGFNALRVPRSDYLPAAVLVQQRDGMPSMFGTLADSFEDVIQPSPVIGAAGQFSAATTASYKKKTALKIASEWLKLTATDLSGAFGGAKRVTFRFGDMRILSVPLGAISQILLAAEPTVALLGLAESRIFVITEVLQAKEFLFLAEGESRQAVSLASGAIDPAALKIDGTFDAAKAGSGLLVFKAAEPHTIGFKAYEIEVSGGDLRLRQSPTSSGLSHMASQDRDYVPTIFGELLL
jgi:hypothetical protein